MRDEVFVARTRLSHSPSAVFRWHERPGALLRLTPPWERVRVIHAEQGLRDGGRTLFTLGLGPMRARWLAELEDCDPPGGFTDRQVRGPFRRWTHRHSFAASEEGNCLMEDRVTWRLPLHLLSRPLIGRAVRHRLERMFRYRREITSRDLDLSESRRPMRVAVTGATGLIGRRLVPFLSTQGHEITVLSRRGGPAPGTVRWDPSSYAISSPLEGFDAVIHLAGEPVGRWPWTKKRMSRIAHSRTDGTAFLAAHCASRACPPAVFISASAVGYYGDRDGDILSEEEPPGEDFLSRVCAEWEKAALPAADAGIRTVQARIGIVLDPAGGALGSHLPWFRAGLGAVAGGRQYWSWISIEDCLRALEHALFSAVLHGPVNITAPSPVTAGEFADCLACVLGRPRIITLPPVAIAAAMGQMGKETVLSSARADCRKLESSGYTFIHRDLAGALRWLLGPGPCTGGRPE